MTAGRRTVGRGFAHAAGVRRALALACAAGIPNGCELTEVSIADPDDVIIAEFVLVAGANRQSGILHRTVATSGSSVPVNDAVVEIQAVDGSTLRLHLAAPDACLVTGEGAPSGNAACYRSDFTIPIPFVFPGNEYTLRVELADGRVLTGVTTVPAMFQLVRPHSSVCGLPPDQPFEVVWTRSQTAWVYAAETELRGLSHALALRGIELNRDPLRLFGLAVSNTDTTIAFPAEFGVFDRFDPDLTEALAAIQIGLPPDVQAEVVIAAADRNYVNWERGGMFNPSGFVRVPSVFGDGTGVFGSVSSRTFLVIADAAIQPPC